MFKTYFRKPNPETIHLKLHRIIKKQGGHLCSQTRSFFLKDLEIRVIDSPCYYGLEIRSSTEFSRICCSSYKLLTRQLLDKINKHQHE